MEDRNIDALEKWAAIPGYEGSYEVSTLGNVRSLSRTMIRVDGHRLVRSGRPLAPHVQAKGYLQIRLSRNGHGRQYLVHRLVLLAFVGQCPQKHETRHLNGVRTDNRLSNLAYGTASENAHDRTLHGTHNMASRQECPHGHPYSPDNTTLSKGKRYCRTCAKRHRDARRNRKALSMSGDAR